MKTPIYWLGVALAGLGFALDVSAAPEPPTTPPADTSIDRGWSEVVPPTHTDPSYPTVRPPQKPGAADEVRPATIDESPAAAVPGDTIPVSPAVTSLAPYSVPVTSSGISVFAEVDFLQWWYRGTVIPPLVTSGTAIDPVPGALNQPGTQVLGDRGPGVDSVNGLRARAGGTFGVTPFGVEFGWFGTRPFEVQETADSFRYPVLARPYYDALLNAESSLLFGFADAFDGGLAISTRTSLWGFEANATSLVISDYGLTCFIGYRYVQLQDDLQITGTYTAGPNSLAFINGFGLQPGATGYMVDRFYDRNEFQGGQIGGRYRSKWDWIGLDVRASLAVGNVNQRVSLQGFTDTVDADGTIRTGAGGLLVQPSNMGEYARDRLTVIPEASAKVFFNVLSCVSLSVGYDCMYWASVVRAADQIDRVVDTRQSPTSPAFVLPVGTPGARPIAPFQDSAFWAHGINVGIRVDY